VRNIKSALFFVCVAAISIFAQDEYYVEQNAEEQNIVEQRNEPTAEPNNVVEQKQNIEQNVEYRAPEYNTRIGIFNLYSNNDDSLMVVEAVRSIRDALHEIGRYDVFTQNRMEDAYSLTKKHFPDYCHEPRCVAIVGATLELERMIFGDVAFNSNKYAVELQMVDVVSKKIVSKSSVEGNEGVALNDVIRTAIFNMHEIDTLSNPADLHRYFGAEVNNVKPMIISTGAYMGLAVLMAIIGNDYRNGEWVKIDEKLSGIDPSMRTIAKSARAKAMGNCYVALSKDAYGAFYNPAGASWINGPEMSANYQSRFGLLNTISASFVNKATREIGWGHTLIYSGHPESFYQELYFSTLASYRFSNVGKLPPFSLGANINISSARTMGGSGSEYDQKGTATGVGLDIGFLIESSDNIDFGLVFNNIPTFNFYNNGSSSEKEIGNEIYTQYRYKENSPASLNLGGSFNVSYATMLVCEGKIPLYKDQAWRFAGGIEQQIANAVRIRFGAEKQIFEVYDTPWHLTAGGGIRFPVKRRNIDIDASYEFITDLELRHIWDISLKIDL